MVRLRNVSGWKIASNAMALLVRRVESGAYRVVTARACVRDEVYH